MSRCDGVWVDSAPQNSANASIVTTRTTVDDGDASCEPLAPAAVTALLPFETTADELSCEKRGSWRMRADELLLPALALVQILYSTS
jgi:hypothetical protein